MDHSFGMQVTMHATQGQGDQLAAIMLQASQLVSVQPGCQLYVVFQGMSNPDQVMITEAWDNQQAHQSALADAEIMALIHKAKPLIEQMDHHTGRLLGGLGLE